MKAMESNNDILGFDDIHDDLQNDCDMIGCDWDNNNSNHTYNARISNHLITLHWYC